MRRPPPLELTGKRLGRWTFVRRTDGRAPDNSWVWLIRCACGSERLLSTSDYRTCRSKGCEPKCANCGTRRSAYRCGICRLEGHHTTMCPKRKHGRTGICLLCAGLPHRVIGPRCRACLLPYADQPSEGIDYGARQPGNLARGMVEQ